MKSKEVLPEKYRLTELQKVQLEGFKSNHYSNAKDHFQGSIYTQAELLLKYHQALLEAEKEINELQSILDDDNFERRNIENN